MLTSKVVSFGVLLDDSIVALDGCCCSTFNEEELLSGISFPDDIFALLECPGFQNVGNLGTLLRLEGCEDRDFGQERFVEMSLSGGVLVGQRDRIQAYEYSHREGWF